MSGEVRRGVLRSGGAGVAVRVAAEAEAACRAVAGEIAALVRGGDGGGGGSAPVLGLATGSTPLGVYRELARLVHGKGLSFAGVTAFALDEYLGLAADHPASFGAYVQRHVTAPLGLDPARVHVPRLEGGGATEGSEEHACAAYERAIEEAGGIDLLLLGIGGNGHLAFNEPGSPRSSRTRAVELAPETRAANARHFPAGQEVPRRAITMGIATILAARRLRVLAFGAHKAEIVRRALEEPVGAALPATFLREHAAAHGQGDVELWLDPPAAAALAHSNALGDGPTLGDATHPDRRR